MSLADDFADLFEGRKDAYGADYGGSVSVVDTPEPARERLFVDHMKRHLDGVQPIGVYPMVRRLDPYDEDSEFHVGGWAVKWGCVDFDIKSEMIEPVKPTTAEYARRPP